MCKPIRVPKEKANLSAIRNQIMGAASSMNMPPEVRPDFDQMEATYLTDIYIYAQHAHEHAVAAVVNVDALRQALNDISWALRSKGENELSRRLDELMR